MTLVTWFDFDGSRVVTQFDSDDEAEIFAEYLGVQGLWRVRDEKRYGQETATRDARALQIEVDAHFSHNMEI